MYRKCQLTSYLCSQAACHLEVGRCRALATKGWLSSTPGRAPRPGTAPRDTARSTCLTPRPFPGPSRGPAPRAQARLPAPCVQPIAGEFAQRLPAPPTPGISLSRPCRELRREDGGGRGVDAAGEVPGAEQREQVQRSGRAPGEKRRRRGGEELAGSGACGAGEDGPAGRPAGAGGGVPQLPRVGASGLAGARGLLLQPSVPERARDRPQWARPELCLPVDGRDRVLGKRRESPRAHRDTSPEAERWRSVAAAAVRGAFIHPSAAPPRALCGPGGARDG